MKKFLNGKAILAILLVVIGMVSILAMAKVATNPETYKEIYQTLDEKKNAVLGMSATMTAASVTIAAIPSDATTPIANKIADLTSYLILILGVIFLEELLLTILGGVSCYVLIPLACFLCAIYLFTKKELLKVVAFKSFVFGLALIFLVPTSVFVTDAIEKSYEAMSNAEKVQVEEVVVEQVAEEPQEEETGGWWQKITGKIKQTAQVVGDKAVEGLEQAKEMLSDLINGVAVLIITSCVIPLLVLICFVWLIKYIFGLKISVSDMKNTVKKAITLKKEEELIPAEKE